jgi:hypothetical protein
MTEQKKEVNDFYVYEHLRVDTGEPFYVGKGRRKRAFRSDGRSDFWKRIVQKSGGFTVRFVAKNLSEKIAFELEVKRIAALKRSGARICNLTAGGEGLSGYVPTEIHKKRISDSKSGKKMKIEHVKRSAEKKTIKMVGKKFGRLTVLSIWGERQPGRHPKWICVCECGNECERSSTALRTGKNPSCGCATRDFQRKKNDISGKRFGRLLAKSPLPDSNKNRHIMWECLCDCGNTSIVAGIDLRGGHTKSCGCLHSQCVREANYSRRKHEKQRMDGLPAN